VSFLVTQTLLGKANSSHDHTRETYVPVGFQGRDDVAHSLRAEASRTDKPSSSTYAVVLPGPSLNASNNDFIHVAPTLSTKNEVASSSTQRQRWMEQSAAMFGAVRRLTPRECERLQGFPDDWTLIDGDKTPDAPRYRALGNAVAVPVAEWIGRRIVEVEKRRRLRQMG